MAQDNKKQAGPTAATEKAIKKVANKDATPQQEHEIDHIVEATSLPRAVIEEQVKVKHPTPDETVVNAEDDDASVAAKSEVYPDLLPEPKRVVQGTSQEDTDEGLHGNRQDPLAG